MNRHRKRKRPLWGALVLGLALLRVAGAEGAEPVMSLDEAKRIALERNLGLSISKKEAMMAEAEVKIRYSEFFPKLSAESTYSRMGEVPVLRMPAGLFSASPVLPPTEVDVPIGALTNYGARLTLQQPLFEGGAIRYAFEGARLGETLAGELHQKNVEDLLLQVELAYWEVLRTDRLREISDQEVSDLTAHLRVVRAFQDAGSIAYNEVLKTQVGLAEAEQRRLTARNNAVLAKMALNNLLRRDLATVFSAAAPDREEGEELPALEEALKSAQGRRIEIAAAKTEVRLLETREGSAKSGYYPQLSFQAHYDRAKETPVVLPESWEVLGVFRWTFWDWGKVHREVERARWERQKGEDRLQSTMDGIEMEVQEEYLRAVEARERIAVAKQSVGQAEENLRILKERFAAGDSTNTEVLDAESLVITARANQAGAYYEFKSARARLIRAIGMTAPPSAGP